MNRVHIDLPSKKDMSPDFESLYMQVMDKLHPFVLADLPPHLTAPYRKKQKEVRHG